METELAAFEEHSKISAEVFEAAGGYAPTIGIIGAVLGLIHVMENLADSSKLGAGIAVAFVATIYGLIFGITYLVSGSLIAPIVAHGAYDAVALLAYWFFSGRFK